MALAIATNTAALNAAASASSVNRDMETSMARLSTGKRINSASDDAAGVAISSRLSAEIRGTDQAIRNSLDGQALIDTAEGAHKEIENILQRMREVSVQAANDTNNSQDRANLQAEMDAMIVEVDRIASTTTWAGENLMQDSTGTAFSFQVGAATGTENQIRISIEGMGSKNLGLAASSEAERATNTLAQTAHNALVATETAAIADVATKAPLKITADANLAAAIKQTADVAAVSLQTVTGTTTTASTAEEHAAAVRDGLNAGLSGSSIGMVNTLAEAKLDVATITVTAEKTAAEAKLVEIETAIAAFKATTTDADAKTGYEAVDAKFDELLLLTDTGNKIAVTAIKAVDTAFGVIKTAAAAYSDTTAAKQTLADTAAANLVTSENAAAVATAARKASVDPADLQGQSLSVSSGTNARTSITTIDAAIQTVNIQRSELGAVSNRLNHTVNNLTNISSNLSAAKGGIEDADFALETTNLAKNQILQQASTAMLAQANASQQNVLALLRV
jgi:flagellin